MASSRPQRSGDKAVELLAVVVTIAGGLFACAFMCLAFSSTPRDSLLACGGVFLLVVLLLWLLRARDPHDRRDLLLDLILARRHRKKRVQYQLQRRSPHEADLDPPRQPPTLEELQELKEQGRTWIPSATSQRRGRHGTET